MVLLLLVAASICLPELALAEAPSMLKEEMSRRKGKHSWRYRGDRTRTLGRRSGSACRTI